MKRGASATWKESIATGFEIIKEEDLYSDYVFIVREGTYNASRILKGTPAEKATGERNCLVHLGLFA